VRGSDVVVKLLSLCQETGLGRRRRMHKAGNAACLCAADCVTGHVQRCWRLVKLSAAR